MAKRKTAYERWVEEQARKQKSRLRDEREDLRVTAKYSFTAAKTAWMELPQSDETWAQRCARVIPNTSQRTVDALIAGKPEEMGGNYEERLKALADEYGLAHYFTGKPCKHGHVCQRRVSDPGCLECSRIRVSTKYATPEGREASLARNRDYMRTPKGIAHNRANAAAYRAKMLDDPETREDFLEKRRELGAKYIRTTRGKEVSHISAMKSKYGIPTWMAPYIFELKATGNCPACGVKFGPPGSTRGACIDHDHDTGEVRAIICNICNTVRLCRCDDGRNPDALLLAAGRNAKTPGRLAKARAIIQLRLAAMLIEHYATSSPFVAKALSIPMPGQQRYEIG
jgi:hypothetical protein